MLCDNMWGAYGASSMDITFLRGNKEELVAERLECGKVINYFLKKKECGKVGLR